jgi:alpha-1,3-rhamnosyl/mannosyltransferase
MRVIFNQLSALKPLTGVGSYVVQLSAALAQHTPVELVPFPAGRTRQLAQLLYRADSTTASKPSAALWPSLLTGPRRLARELSRQLFQVAFRVNCFTGGYDLYHEPNYLPWSGPVPTIITVHDLSVLRHPDWHPIDRVRHYEAHFVRAVQHARHLIAVSEFTRQEIIHFLGIAPERVTTVYNGYNTHLRPMSPAELEQARHTYQLPEQYILAIGTIEPRKNLSMLMHAYCALPRAVRDRCPLLLVGPWGWRSTAVQDFFHTTARHANVRHLGYLPAAALCAVYCGARALAYPSHYEGFGLPPLEMRACGGAVLASSADVHQELFTDQADLLAANDQASWTEALHRIITDDDYHTYRCQNGPTFAKQYTWQRAAQSTYAVYGQLTRRGSQYP